MAETRAEQVVFGWAGEGSAETEERPSTPRPLRGRYARGERGGMAAILDGGGSRR
ncbi:hypothetical protein AMOR_32090 [Anaeromyxobacter oryzae]|uniref:Uncharacterized protein n=1 Tax=Anaeromyxobacter oryzae TaxID=2918170 RepID=A0ABM7WXH6_9BACT|nr:hypothetical protein AMOR_32090 [Anaeromyxobacter oryzae]